MDQTSAEQLFHKIIKSGQRIDICRIRWDGKKKQFTYPQMRIYFLRENAHLIILFLYDIILVLEMLSSRGYTGIYEDENTKCLWNYHVPNPDCAVLPHSGRWVNTARFMINPVLPWGHGSTVSINSHCGSGNFIELVGPCEQWHSLLSGPLSRNDAGDDYNWENDKYVSVTLNVSIKARLL